MFRCWGCGNDYPDVPYASLAEAKMWEDQAVGYALVAKQKRLDNYRKELIESYSQGADEYQQGILDGLKIAISILGE